MFYPAKEGEGERERTKERDRESDLMFNVQSTAKSHQGKTKCIPTTCTDSDSLLNTHSTVEDWRNLGKMEVEREGRRERERAGERLRERERERG